VDGTLERTAGRFAPAILIVALAGTAALGGCRREIPEDKARAMFQEMAVELIKRQDAGDAARAALVDAICEKNGFVRKDVEYLLRMDSQAEGWLVEAFKAEIARDLEEQKAQWEKRLAKASQNVREDVTELEGTQAERLAALEQENTRKAAEIDAEYAAREKDLKARLDALTAELTPAAPAAP